MGESRPVLHLPNQLDLLSHLFKHLLYALVGFGGGLIKYHIMLLRKLFCSLEIYFLLGWVQVTFVASQSHHKVVTVIVIIVVHFVDPVVD